MWQIYGDNVEGPPFWISEFNSKTAGKMKMLLFFIFLYNLVVASFGDSVEGELQRLQEKVNQLEQAQQGTNQLEMNQVRSLQQKVNQLERQQEDMRNKHETKIFELKRQQASMAGTVYILLFTTHNNSRSHRTLQRPGL